MKESTNGAKPVKETVFPEGGPIKSAAFDKASNTLYVTYSSGERKAYSPRACRDNVFKYVEADIDEEDVQERIRQEVQARIDEAYDGEGPREVAHYVMVRPYQVSGKAFAQAMNDYADKAQDMLYSIASGINGKDSVDEIEANRFFNGFSYGLMNQVLGRIRPGKRCVVLEDEDGGKSYFYTNGKMIGEKDLWYKALPPLSELGSPA